MEIRFSNNFFDALLFTPHTDLSPAHNPMSLLGATPVVPPPVALPTSPARTHVEPRKSSQPQQPAPAASVFGELDVVGRQLLGFTTYV